jgi:hypothetical protein
MKIFQKYITLKRKTNYIQRILHLVSEQEPKDIFQIVK